jgi:predicted membrane protein
MGFMFSGLFWGVVVVLLGLTIIINVAFGVKIPLFRIVFGLILIYWGVSLIAGSSFRSRSTTAFSDSEIRPTKAVGKHDIIFGKGVIDLSNVSLSDRVNRYEVNTVFGSSVIRLNPTMPVKVVVSSAFAGARLPDGNTMAFGEYTYRSPNLKEDSAYLLVKASVVFGGLEVENR